MRNKPRRWDAAGEDDPLAGLVNLFDVWMVFSIALLLALIGASRFQTPPATANDASEPKASSLRESVLDKRHKLPQYRLSEEKLTGQGERLGTAYRLQSGEVVYVPD